MEKSLFTKIVVLAMILFLSSCAQSPSSSGPLSDKEVAREVRLKKEELEINLLIWQDHNFENYRYNFDVGLFNQYSDLTPVTIEVKDGVAVLITIASGRYLSPLSKSERVRNAYSYFAQFDTIDKIYSYVLNVIERGDDFNGTFNSNFGIPTWICYGYCYYREPVVEDGGNVMYITNFEIIP